MIEFRQVDFDVTPLFDMAAPAIIARMLDLERKCAAFLTRTGLRSSDCIIVEFRSKQFIQWRGAVDVLPKSPPWSSGCWRSLWQNQIEAHDLYGRRGNV